MATTTDGISTILDSNGSSVRPCEYSEEHEQTNDEETLESILESQPYLYDLHTHLLGMGNTGFWIESIIEKRQILPPHAEFRQNPKLREQLCPLIWNKDGESNGTFINGKKTAMFFHYLIEKNYPNCKTDDILDLLGNINLSEKSEFRRLIENNTFSRQLQHYGLSFGRSDSKAQTPSDAGDQSKSNMAGDFTYDVVLTLSDLRKALGIAIPWMTEFEDLIQSKVEEKLGLHTYQQSIQPLKDRSSNPDASSRPFRRWIIFNARDQAFNVVKGITIETLRKYITVEANAPSQKCTLARAHIQNAFSMRNPDGTDPRPIDFDRFHGSFTPEFYPRRFALKDSLYSQRLDILAALLVHVLRRYQSCLPPIRYCELSIGIGDLCRPWVFDVLRSFPPDKCLPNDKKPISGTTKFRKMIQDDHFPHLRNACPKSKETKKRKLSCVPNVTYKFLAGFNRQTIVEHRLKDQIEAFRLLNDSPDVAIQYMLEQLAKSEEEEERFCEREESSQISTEETRDTLFSKALADLQKLQETALKNPSFYNWVVGLDLFGDEMGYPYCPFVAWPFIRYIRERRIENKKFGLRIHCGENLPFADIDVGAYRHFIAHMYIVFRCLRFLQRKLTYGIRIGHGVAFARILSDRMSKLRHRKSSVLLAEMKDHAKYVLPKIVFEINITSNEYLLGQALREGDHHQTIRLYGLTNLDIPIILATDDDGIWPIDNCPSKHAGHHSLVAEYCRAFSSSLIVKPKNLRKMLKDTSDSCFYSFNNTRTSIIHTSSSEIKVKDDRYASTIVFHPDLIKTVLRKYSEKNRQDSSIYQYYSKLYYQDPVGRIRSREGQDALCNSMARFVFMHYYDIQFEDSSNNYAAEYEWVFGNEPSFETVKIFWSKVWYRFINTANQTRSNHISASENGPVFLSQCSHLEKQELPYLFDKLNRDHFRGRDVRVFTSEVSRPAELVRELNEKLKNHRSANSIKVFTTKNKDEHIDSPGMENGLVVINKMPDKRTNYYGMEEKHLLYVICQHASAATACLHHIGHQIARDYQQISGNSYQHENSVFNCQEHYQEGNQHDHGNYQPEDPTPQNNDDSDDEMNLFI